MPHEGCGSGPETCPDRCTVRSKKIQRQEQTRSRSTVLLQAFLYLSCSFRLCMRQMTGRSASAGNAIGRAKDREAEPAVPHAGGAIRCLSRPEPFSGSQNVLIRFRQHVTMDTHGLPIVRPGCKVAVQDRDCSGTLRQEFPAATSFLPTRFESLAKTPNARRKMIHQDKTCFIPSAGEWPGCSNPAWHRC